MKKMLKIILLVISFLFLKNYSILAYNSYEPGDKIRYKNDYYYVIRASDSDTDYVTVLKEKALTVEDINKYGRNENGELFVNKFIINFNDPEKAIYENRDGSGDIAYYNSDQCRAEYSWNGSGLDFFDKITTKCNNSFDNSDIKKVLDNWANDTIKSKDLAEVDGYKVRLLTGDDLALLGYDYYCPSRCYAKNENVSQWFKDAYYGKFFWTMHSFNDNNSAIGVIESSSHLNDPEIFQVYPVVPVVNLKKSSDQEIVDNNIVKFDVEKVKETNKKVYNANEQVIYKDEEYYVLNKSDSDSDYVTLVKDKPLTYDDIYKYYGYEGLELVNDKYGAVKFISESGSYEDSNVKQIIDKWVKDKFGMEVYNARLLTIDDLLDYLYFDGDIRGTEGYNFISGSDTPNWVMNESYRFWMMTMYEDSNEAWYVNNYHQGLNGSEAYYGKTDYYYSSGSKIYLPVYATIRPVIKVHKCALDENDNGCLECLRKKMVFNFKRYATFQQGETVTLNGEEFYVARTSNLFMPYVRLIRKNPFTALELNKYGVDNSGNSVLNNYVYVNDDINDEENIAQNQHFYRNPDDFVSNSKERSVLIHGLGLLRYQVVTPGLAYEYDDGIGGMQYYSSNECGFVDGRILKGDACITDYNQSLVKIVIDNWVDDKLNSDDLIRINGYSSRLINLDDNDFLQKSDLLKDYTYWIQPGVEVQPSPSGYSYKIIDYCTSQYSCETVYQTIYRYSAVWPVIFVDKCALDGGCYSEDVELNACYAEMLPEEGVTIIEVENTKKVISIITIILSSILFVVGFAILSINYIKSRFNK